MTQFTGAMRRWGPVPVLMLVAMAALLAPGADAMAKAKKARPARQTVETAQRTAGEPIMAIVSIKSQRVTFYDADGWIMRAPVSTGTKGRETPAGVFAVIEKDKDHHSSMYDDAWMPNMQRITWNGIALHGGPLPGYAASHGCIRMPYGFAATMFDKTQIGMRVIISPKDAVPLAFSHPALFQPNAEAIAAAPARAETLAGEAADAVTAAADAKKAATKAAREAKAAAADVRKLKRLKKRADARLASADKAIAAADKAQVRAADRQQKAVAKDADLTMQLYAARMDTKAKRDGDAASMKKALRTLERQKKRADSTLASADKRLAAAGKAKVPAEDRQQKAAAEAADLATQLATATTDVASKQDAAAAAKIASKEADTRKTDAAKAASEAKLALEPVSVYISRATQTLYVRRNTHKPWPDGGEVFDSSIEAPVTIRDPDKPIGTHVFTAMADDNGALRWSAVTIEDADNATDALDRITIPEDVLDRIAPTAMPRSSIIVSDEPLSKETNYRTEFVAVLSDYPQGGFITRRAPAKKTYGLFPSFQRNFGSTGRRVQYDWLGPPRR